MANEELVANQADDQEPEEKEKNQLLTFEKMMYVLIHMGFLPMSK